jgi:hypothetical protein
MNPTGKGGFKAGVSGNPGGRPRAVEEVRELARAHCPDAIAELARLAVKAKSESARIAAIRELLDRGYGKATQPLAGETRPDGEPFEFTLKIGQVNADGSRTVAEVRPSPPVALPKAGGGDVLPDRPERGAGEVLAD